MAVRKKYKFAVIATDVVLFTVRDEKLQVLLIKMKKPPFEGQWAVPGGLVRPKESVDESARRHLKDEAGVKNVYLEQLYTFGKVDRDPFGRVVSVAYFALVPHSRFILKTTDLYEDVAWFPVAALPKLAYDHREIIGFAEKRLMTKVEYSNIVYSLLPAEFSLGELQKVYEIILNRALDKRNFRKKILSLGLLKNLGKKRAGGANRPAELYTFKKHVPQLVELV